MGAGTTAAAAAAVNVVARVLKIRGRLARNHLVSLLREVKVEKSKQAIVLDFKH